MTREHAWMGFAPCGHPVFVSIEDPGGPDAETLRALARLRDDGRTIERLPWAEAKERMGTFACQCVPTKAEVALRKKRRRR